MEVASNKQKLHGLSVKILMKTSANNPNKSCKNCAIETICMKYPGPNSSGLNICRN